MSTAKYFFIIFGLFVLGVSAKADFPNHEPFTILQNTDGSILLMNHQEATGVNPITQKKEKLDACEVRGKGRLATIRGLLLRTQAEYAAKGIQEAYPGIDVLKPDYLPWGYSAISAVNPNGVKDGFYYSNEGYHYQTYPGIAVADLPFAGCNAIWSSSAYSYISATYYIFNGVEASVYGGTTDSLAAVACSNSWPQNLSQCWWCH